MSRSGVQFISLLEFVCVRLRVTYERRLVSAAAHLLLARRPPLI